MKKYSDKIWRLDQFLALHQRLCWGICAFMVLLAALLTANGQEWMIYLLLALALLLMGAYHWMRRAPVRALSGWMERRKAGTADLQAGLAFVLKMEKALPSMLRKELAFLLVNVKAIFLFDTGSREEALSLLENFTDTWDESQRENIRNNIRKMREIMGHQAREKEE